jgi:hypothetical protein
MVLTSYSRRDGTAVPVPYPTITSLPSSTYSTEPIYVTVVPEISTR